MNELATQNVELPAYLQGKKGAVGLEDMTQFAVPPRIKIIQSQTKAPYKPPFVDGDIIIVPNMTKIGDKENPFTFTPIYFFDSYVCFNPIQATHLQAVREISLDPGSELALKCKQIGYTESCPEMPNQKLKYNATLNFMVMIHGKDAPIVPVLFSFRSGEYKTGQMLINLIQNRGVDIFANRLRAASSAHSSKGNSWYGLDPGYDPTPFVTDEQYATYGKLHEIVKTAVRGGKVKMDYGDTDMDNSVVDSGKF